MAKASMGSRTFLPSFVPQKCAPVEPFPVGAPFLFLLFFSTGSKEDALRLSDLTSTFPCKVNLIMFNRFPGAPFAPTSEAKAQEFQDTLKANGVKAFLRLSRGDDAMAACGQLGSPGLK